MWNTFQRLRLEEFSSGDSAGDFGLRSFLRKLLRPKSGRRVGLHSKSPAEENFSSAGDLL